MSELSDQERRLEMLAKHSFGGSFVFIPDRYRKGNAPGKQPADMVWLGNDCAILMNMTASDASRENLYLHNIPKLQGWVRVWSKGRNLEGRNSFQTFSVPYKDSLHLVLISVVDGPNAWAEHHDDVVASMKSKGYRVTCCATLPGKVFDYIARNGGGIRDLLHVIHHIRDYPGGTSEDFAIDTATRLHKEAVQSSKIQSIPSPYMDREALEKLTQYVLTLKGTEQDRGVAQADKDKLNLFEVLNDLTWANWTALIATLFQFSRAVELASPNSPEPSAVGGRIKCWPYQFVIGAQHVGAPESFKNRMTSIYSQVENESPGYPPVLLILMSHPEFMHMMIGAKPRTGQSMTSQILESWSRRP